MPSVLSVTTGGAGTLSGSLFIADPGVANLRRLYWPAGVNAIARHGTGYVYANRNYLMGAWSANLLIDENFRVLRQGIIPPQSPPSVVAGGGATEQICYLSFYDAFTDERSSLSEGTSITGNTTRTWSNLPTTVPGEAAVIEGLVDIAGAAPTQTVTQASGSVTNFAQLHPGEKVARADIPTQYAIIRDVIDDQNMVVDGSLANGAGVGLLHKPISRCTHLELWVSVAGALPRLAARVPLGVTGWTESVGTLSLGEAFLDTFEPLRFCGFNTTYGDRQWAAGDPRNPDTLYGSALFTHERWEGLSFRTKFGEPITALIKTRDYMLVCCPASSYYVQGYTEDDLSMKGCASDLGCFGPNTWCVVRDLVFLWNTEGIFIFNGAFHRVNINNQSKFKELAKRFPREYATGICVYDPDWDCIYFIPNYDDFEGTSYNDLTTLQRAERVIWVLGNISEIAGVEAGGFSSGVESWDTPYVVPTADGLGGNEQLVSAAYLVPTGNSIGQFIRVGREGSVVVECEPNDPAAPDAGLELWSGHLFMNEVGGDVQEGKCFKRHLSYFYGEYATCVWNLYAGNEYAQGDDIQRRSHSLSISDVDINDLYAHHEVSIPPSLDERTFPTVIVPNSLLTWGVYDALTVHAWPEEATGRGLTSRFRFSGKNVEFYGYGGYYGPGVAGRPLTYATAND